ncbi:MAG: NAD-dependent epimerase/dehydratase family protein, partial [Cytophagales bacterium]|nr:NAD-dependent epimerase/dehydratase family protein [Cytophagales bacterium]
MNKILVTGSAGLIGSDVTAFFASKGWHVIGIDNNMRADFFGSNGDTKWNRDRLVDTYKNYEHHDIDLRDRNKVAD